eukprot:3765408-Amphidinium_carterae.1
MSKTVYTNGLSLLFVRKLLNGTSLKELSKDLNSHMANRNASYVIDSALTYCDGKVLAVSTEQTT